MTPREMVAHRRSVRAYTGVPLSEAEKEAVLSSVAALPSLVPGQVTRAELLTRAEARCTLPMPWLPPDLLAIYAAEGTRALVNVGFVFGRLDLILQAEGFGACWLGLGRPRAPREADGLSFAMMMAIGHPQDVPLRSGAADFRRHSLTEIADVADDRLEPARLAASAVNGQPWYFTHEGEVIHVFCVLRRSRMLHDMNRIDVGIALAQLAVSYPDRFAFFDAETPPVRKGYEYIGSIRL